MKKWWIDVKNDDGITWRQFGWCVVWGVAIAGWILVYSLWPRVQQVKQHDGDEVNSGATSNFTCLPDYDGFADNFDPVVEPESKPEPKPKPQPQLKPKHDSMDYVLDRLTGVENVERDPNLVGDRHLRHKAYGELQIRQPYLNDVNRIAGTSGVMKAWGKSKLTIQDMKDPEKARWAAKVYLRYYGKAYKRQTGKDPNLEVYGRIHNGGPDGWAEASTNEYARRLREGK